MWILTKSALFYEFYFFFLYWAPVYILAFVSAKASITFTSLNHRTIKRAVRDAQNDGYSEGWNAGRKDKQEKDYNSGWSAGYEFCLNENKTIRNNYDEGYDDGYDSGFGDGYSEGYRDGFSEASPD